MPQSAYFFQLGSTPELSQKELEAVLGRAVTIISARLAQVELSSDEEAQSIFARLGGSLKVMKEEGTFENLTEEEIPQYVVAYLAQTPRPTFAIAEFGRDNKPRINPTEIKPLLKKREISSRFIEGPRDGLSASVLLHQEVIEVGIIQSDSTIYLAKTLAVQDIDEWSARDREKPYADRKKGMLPPKVARMMINLAVAACSSEQEASDTSTLTIYDPFCGTGTVLAEALENGYDAVGSDLDQTAVQGATTNLEWLVEKDELQGNYSVFYSDVAAVTLKHLDKPVDAIVTEPFLGKQTPQPQQLPNIFKGLEKMYLGAFKQWTKILQPKAAVCIVFPFAKTEKQQFSLEGMIDKLAQLGYTPFSEPVMYHRPNAIIHRQIWTFQFNRK